VTDKRLISSRSCDRLYGMRNGTAAASYRAGLLPGRWRGKPSKIRGGKVRQGKTLFVSAKRAAELFDATTFHRKTA
jgi:hypothetical protein